MKRKKKQPKPKTTIKVKERMKFKVLSSLVLNNRIDETWTIGGF